MGKNVVIVFLITIIVFLSYFLFTLTSKPKDTEFSSCYNTCVKVRFDDAIHYNKTPYIKLSDQDTIKMNCFKKCTPSKSNP